MSTRQAFVAKSDAFRTIPVMLASLQFTTEETARLANTIELFYIGG
jgi:hypothetical protein